MPYDTSMKITLTSGIRMVLGLLAIAAIITDISHGFATIPGFSLVNYFSFFTVLSTTLTSIVLLATVFYKDIPYMRGAATLFMVITGIVYFILLRNEPIEIAWVNAVYHYILPVALLVDWIVNPPKTKLPLGKAFLWLLFPAAFFAYSLVRGAITDWYPYPFMNVAQIGYEQTVMNSIVVGLGMVALAAIVGVLPRLRMSHTK